MFAGSVAAQKAAATVKLCRQQHPQVLSCKKETETDKNRKQKTENRLGWKAH